MADSNRPYNKTEDRSMVDSHFSKEISVDAEDVRQK